MQGGWHRQAAAVNNATGKIVFTGEIERGIAKQTADLALGCDEVGCAGGVQDVFVGRVFALGSVGGQ